MEKYDIGLVIATTYNYGNGLTNYALYHYLKKRGYSVLVIDAPWRKNTFLPYFCKDRTELFLENPYEEKDLAREFQSRWDVEALNECCRMFILGSDQLFNHNFGIIRNGEGYTYLDWVSSDKYKMSYATSFGNAIYKFDWENLGYLLKRFQRIGIREKQAADYLNEQYGIAAMHVIDPIFLAEREKYYEMAQKGKERLPQGSYIGAYFLDPDEWKCNTVTNIAEQRTEGRKLVISGPKLRRCDRDYPDIPRDFKEEEWMALIEKSDFFITDSFHGMCLALLYHKKFLVLFHKDSIRGLDRMKSLLAQIGLEERLILDLENGDIEDIIQQPIDYLKVDEILNKIVGESEEWLQLSIKEGFSYNAKENEYDIFRKEKYQLRKALEEKTLECKKLKHQRWLDNLEKEKGIQKIVAWGAGGHFCNHIRKIKEVYDLDIVFDKDSRKWMEEYYPGVLCTSPEVLWNVKDVIVLIMVNNESIVREIEKELLVHGISVCVTFEQWAQIVLND